MQAATCAEQGYGITISLRLVAWPAIVTYAIQIFTSSKILVADAATAPLGVALLVTAALQTALMLVASILELSKCIPSQAGLFRPCRHASTLSSALISSMRLSDWHSAEGRVLRVKGMSNVCCH